MTLRLPASLPLSDALERVLDAAKQHVVSLGEAGRLSGLVEFYEEAIRVVEGGETVKRSEAA